MGTLKPNAEIIYESPDGGDTVYGRYSGTTERFLVGISSRRQKINDELKQDKLWKEIREAAETNPALKNALEQCIMLYYISKNNGSET